MTNLTSASTESGSDTTVEFKSGIVAIIGRANVGKSTLLNQLLNTKLAAVSPKPQTTQTRILGILSGERYQAVLLDTPGRFDRARDELDRRMLQESARALEEANLVVLMVEPRLPGDVERKLVQEVQRRQAIVLLAINKIDTVSRSALLPVIDAYRQLHSFAEIVPISASRMDGVDLLLELVVNHLPVGVPLFSPDQITDRSERFRVAEIVREKLFLLYREELPYAAAVTIEEWREPSPERGPKTYISARIHPEKESQQGILLGKGGLALKRVGEQARQEIEIVLNRPVFLELWVKSRPKWRKDPEFLKRLGY